MNHSTYELPSIMFTVSQLLDHIPSEGGVDTKKLEKILKLTKKADKQKLSIAVDALSKIGIIINNQDIITKDIDNEVFIKARIRCSSKGYSFAIRDDGKEDIYIRDHYLNHAWHGDRVIVKITREGYRRRSPEGSVLCILERNAVNLLALIKSDKDNLIATPVDERIKSMINLTNSIPSTDHSEENLYEIQIERFPIAQYYSFARIVKPLTLKGGLYGDQELLLTKSNIQDRVSAPRSTIKQPIDKNRLDFTKQDSIIIKAWQTESSPISPSLYLAPCNAGFTIYVHIPSIAERLTIGNSLDHWLRENSESINLGNRWIPFINESLKKASIFSKDEENFAITANITIDKSGNMKEWKFSLSKIKPVVELNSVHLKALKARKPNSKSIPTNLKNIKNHIPQIESLLYCSKLISDNEIKSGSIVLDLPIPTIEGLPEISIENPSINNYQWNLPLNTEDPNSILSPIIRLVNRAWYLHIKDLNIPSIINRAEGIEANSLNDIAKALLAMNIPVKLDNNGSIDFDALLNEISESNYKRVLQKLLKNSLPEFTPSIFKNTLNHNDEILSTGEYEDNNQKTNCPIAYPGTCYQDLANQYIQVLLLKEGRDKESSRSKKKVDLGQSNINKEISWKILNETTLTNIYQLANESILNKIRSKKAKTNYLFENLVSMSQTRAIEPLVGKEVLATISGVQSYGFFAELPPIMSEGLVHVSTLNDDWYEYRSRQNKLVGRKSKKSYQLGDEVKVKILKIDLLKSQIDLEVSTDNLAEAQPLLVNNTISSNIDLEEKS